MTMRIGIKEMPADLELVEADDIYADEISTSIPFLSALIPVMFYLSPSLFSSIPSEPYFCLKKVLDF